MASRIEKGFLFSKKIAPAQLTPSLAQSAEELLLDEAAGKCIHGYG